MSETVRQRSWHVAFEPVVAREFLTIGPDQAGTRNRLNGKGVTVEALFAISGMRPHGLLTAHFAETDLPFNVLAVDSGPFKLVEPSLTGLLDRPLYVGLPIDLADAAAEGVRHAAGLIGLTQGTLTLAGGGIDVDSSPAVFKRLGEAVVISLNGLLAGKQVAPLLETALSTW